jgi:hypothetical protein
VDNPSVTGAPIAAAADVLAINGFPAGSEPFDDVLRHQSVRSG